MQHVDHIYTSDITDINYVNIDLARHIQTTSSLYSYTYALQTKVNNSTQQSTSSVGISTHIRSTMPATPKK